MCQLSFNWALAYIISTALSYLNTLATEDTEVLALTCTDRSSSLILEAKHKTDIAMIISTLFLQGF